MWVSAGPPPPNPRPNSHTQAGTKRPTSVWPYQCHRFVPRSFRVHEVSLPTMRSIARPTVRRAGGGHGHAEPRHRGDKADETRRIIRSLPLIYLGARPLRGTFQPGVDSLRWEKLQPRCNIDVTYLHTLKRSPRTFESFLCTLLSTDLS